MNEDNAAPPGIEPDQHTLDILKQRIMQRIAAEPIPATYEDHEHEYSQYLHRSIAARGLTIHDGVLTAQHHEWVRGLLKES